MSMSTNNDVYANTEARKAIRSRLLAAYSTLFNDGAFNEAMSALDPEEKHLYESSLMEIARLTNIMPFRDGTAADLDM